MIIHWGFNSYITGLYSITNRAVVGVAGGIIAPYYYTNLLAGGM
jgi:hypothetical protein